MNELKNRKPAHAVPKWQAPASTGKPADHRGAERWRWREKPRDSSMASRFFGAGVRAYLSIRHGVGRSTIKLIHLCRVFVLAPASVIRKRYPQVFRCLRLRSYSAPFAHSFGGITCQNYKVG